ncbi:hypothetical protein MKW92_029547 [Papaver armeniacum]|nr:hypothetical protein MKW92_029547 [Papaver armeniacum]
MGIICSLYHVDVHVSIGVVVNERKNESDKFTTFRQWLDSCSQGLQVILLPSTTAAFYCSS